MILITTILSIFAAFVYNPDMLFLKEKIAENGIAMFLTISILIIVILGFLGIFWCFYRLLYGTLLRRLYANYKELKKIDF
jgi:predicted PurR-regulated permease PerM